jgi:hypothetical protein
MTEIATCTPPHCQSSSSTEAEFLGVIGTKVLRESLLAIHSLALTIMKSRKLNINTDKHILLGSHVELPYSE